MVPEDALQWLRLSETAPILAADEYCKGVVMDLRNFRTTYADFRKQITDNLWMEDAKKTRYFSVAQGPRFTLHYDSVHDFDVGVLSLLLAGTARSYDVDFVLCSIGYGTFKISYTVIAKSREEAEAVARFMSNSKRIEALTKGAIAKQVSIQDMPGSVKLMERLNGVVPEHLWKDLPSHVERTVSALVGETEENMGVVGGEEMALPERIASLEAEAHKNPPESDSSFWVLGDAIGAVLGGFVKSMGS